MKNTICLLIAFCFLTNLYGVTTTWTGGTGDWDVPGNWDTGAVPTASDEVIINSGSVTITSGVTASANKVTVGSSTNLTVNGSATLEVHDGFNHDIVVNGTLTNYGTIICSNGTVNAAFNFLVYGTVVNKSGSSIALSNSKAGIYIYEGTFTNEAGGDITITNFDGFGILVTGTSSSIGSFLNSGAITLTNGTSTESAIDVRHDFENTASGTINISDVSGAGIQMAGIVGYSGSITNSGIIEISNASSEAIWVLETFTNAACGLIRSNGQLYVYSGGTFTNNGLIESFYTGSHVNSGTFTNNGFIEDFFNSLPSITNNKVIIDRSVGTGCEGDPFSNALDIGGTSNVIVDGWFTDTTATVSAGTYDLASNEWTPNANAVGNTMFYIQLTDTGTGCSQIFAKKVTGGIIAATDTYYEDGDGDGFGNPAVSYNACSQPVGYVSDNTDCDDTDANEYPGQTWYKDEDGDDYSDGTSLTQCERPANYYLVSELSGPGDCDDSDANEYPGQTWYKDEDGDDYSDGTSLTQCERPANYYLVTELTGPGDCDDSEAAVFPGNPEVCDGLDNDCNGQVDDGVCEGNTCSTPFVVGSLPYVYSGTTNGAGDEYDENDACTSLYMTGDDAVFSYTSGGGEVIRIKLEKTGGPNSYSAHAVFLLDGCPDDPGTSCIASEIHSASSVNNDPIYIETASLSAGTYYIVVSSNGSLHQWFDYTLTVDQPTGNICTNAEIIGSLPYSFSGSTQLLGDDYNNTHACASSYMDGNDVVFVYNSPGGEVARIKLTKTGGPNSYSAHAVFLLDGCPDDPGTSCIASEIHSASSVNNDPIYIETANLSAGTYYIVVSSNGSLHQWFDYQLDIDLPTGNICTNAVTVGSLPYSYAGTTQYLGDEYDNTHACASNYMTGNDVVFAYTCPGNEVARIKLTKTGGPGSYSSHAVFLLDGCPDDPGTNCIDSKVHSTSSVNNDPIYIETANLSAGTYYIVVSSYGAYHQWFDYQLDIELPSGNICENAAAISSLPYTAAGQSTTLYGDDYDQSQVCGSIYLDANDYVYSYTPSSSVAIDIQLSNLSDSRTGIFLVDGIPGSGGVNCVYQTNSGSDDYQLSNVNLIGGQTYYIIISSHPSYTSSFDYDISVAEAGSLPVELVAFNAKMTSQGIVLLDWQTASEINASHFEIEYSKDGFDWENIGETPARGSTSEMHYYTYHDDPAQRIYPTRDHYYRLRMVDRDGSFDYSPIRMVTLERDGDFRLYPNPVSESLYFQNNADSEGTIEFIFTDIAGRLVKRHEAVAEAGSVLHLGEMTGLSPGLYLCSVVRDGRKVWQERLVVTGR